MLNSSSKYPISDGSLASYPAEWSLAFLDLQTPKEGFDDVGKGDGENNNTHRT